MTTWKISGVYVHFVDSCVDDGFKLTLKLECVFGDRGKTHKKPLSCIFPREVRVSTTSMEHTTYWSTCLCHASHLYTENMWETGYVTAGRPPNKPGEQVGLKKRRLYIAFIFFCDLSLSVNVLICFIALNKLFKGGLLICFLFLSRYKKGPLLSISLMVPEPFCWGPQQLHNRPSMSTMKLQCPPFIFFLQWETQLFIDVFFCFSFFEQDLIQQNWQFYIFYNALWLLKNKICGKWDCAF